jgi:NADP-dependent 3-hydroxy acid dehydrogenase YdfG
MEFNKIAITGHTSGIGLALYNMVSQNKSVLGFSRSNGYDIQYNETIDQILEETKDVEVFVNNAYYETQQSLISNKWFELHKNQNHLIINISSIAAEIDCYFTYDKDDPVAPYAKHKRDLSKTGWIMNMQGKLAKSITMSFAVVDTPFDIIPPHLLERTKKNKTVITPDDTANIILKAISDFNKPWFQSNYVIMNYDSFLPGD